jgi:hypothetical protein
MLQDVESFGDALWYSYEYEIDTPKERAVGHGMSMCRRVQDRGPLLNLHNSLLSGRDLSSSSGANHKQLRKTPNSVQATDVIFTGSGVRVDKISTGMHRFPQVCQGAQWQKYTG